MYLIIMIIAHNDDSDATDDIMMIIKTIQSRHNVTDLKYVSLKHIL